MVVNYCTDINVSVIKDSCKQRGWERVDTSEKWNLFFAFTARCKTFFRRDTNLILRSNQMINHFPNSHVLTRKDFLPKVIKKYTREVEKGVALRGDHSKYKHLKIIPTTFVLPQDNVVFKDYYTRHPSTTWIIKPCCRSQGHGIFLTQNPEKLKKCKHKKKIFRNITADNECYVVSKYIDNPLLIGGKKFDIRLYVLVTSYKPLKAYLFNHGFCRFCIKKYNTNDNTLKNHYIHLTNHSIQRRSKKYNKNHGEKWGLNCLKLYLESTLGRDTTEKLFDEMKWVIIHSLRAVQPVISSDRHCFECYGYDIIIDDKLTPWLIEVNASPSIYPTSASDRVLKRKLIDNMLSVILPPSGYPEIWWNKIPSNEYLNDFERLIDEDMEPWSADKYTTSPQFLSGPFPKQIFKKPLWQIASEHPKLLFSGKQRRARSDTRTFDTKRYCKNSSNVQISKRSKSETTEINRRCYSKNTRSKSADTNKSPIGHDSKTSTTIFKSIRSDNIKKSQSITRRCCSKKFNKTNTKCNEAKHMGNMKGDESKELLETNHILKIGSEKAVSDKLLNMCSTNAGIGDLEVIHSESAASSCQSEYKDALDGKIADKYNKNSNIKNEHGTIKKNKIRIDLGAPKCATSVSTAFSSSTVNTKEDNMEVINQTSSNIKSNIVSCKVSKNYNNKPIFGLYISKHNETSDKLPVQDVYSDPKDLMKKLYDTEAEFQSSTSSMQAKQSSIISEFCQPAKTNSTQLYETKSNETPDSADPADTGDLMKSLLFAKCDNINYAHSKVISLKSSKILESKKEQKLSHRLENKDNFKVNLIPNKSLNTILKEQIDAIEEQLNKRIKNRKATQHSICRKISANLKSNDTLKLRRTKGTVTLLKRSTVVKESFSSSSSTDTELINELQINYNITHNRKRKLQNVSLEARNKKTTLLDYEKSNIKKQRLLYECNLLNNSPTTPSHMKKEIMLSADNSSSGINVSPHTDSNKMKVSEYGDNRDIMSISGDTKMRSDSKSAKKQLNSSISRKRSISSQRERGSSINRKSATSIYRKCVNSDKFQHEWSPRQRTEPQISLKLHETSYVKSTKPTALEKQHRLNILSTPKWINRPHSRSPMTLPRTPLQTQDIKPTSLKESREKLDYYKTETSINQPTRPPEKKRSNISKYRTKHDAVTQRRISPDSVQKNIRSLSRSPPTTPPDLPRNTPNMKKLALSDSSSSNSHKRSIKSSTTRYSGTSTMSFRSKEKSKSVLEWYRLSLGSKVTQKSLQLSEKLLREEIFRSSSRGSIKAESQLFSELVPKKSNLLSSSIHLVSGRVSGVQ